MSISKRAQALYGLLCVALPIFMKSQDAALLPLGKGISLLCIVLCCRDDRLLLGEINAHGAHSSQNPEVAEPLGGKLRVA